MDVKIELRENSQVFHISGRLNIDGAEKLKKEAKQLAQEKKTNWIFDLSEVIFIDSSGIGALVACLRTAGNNGGDLRLAAPQSEIRTILELTRLHRLFEIHNTIDEAANSFKK